MTRTVESPPDDPEHHLAMPSPSSFEPVWSSDSDGTDEDQDNPEPQDSWEQIAQVEQATLSLFRTFFDSGCLGHAVTPPLPRIISAQGRRVGSGSTDWSSKKRKRKRNDKPIQQKEFFDDEDMPISPVNPTSPGESTSRTPARHQNEASATLTTQCSLSTSTPRKKIKKSESMLEAELLASWKKPNSRIEQLTVPEPSSAISTPSKVTDRMCTQPPSTLTHRVSQLSSVRLIYWFRIVTY